VIVQSLNACSYRLNVTRLASTVDQYTCFNGSIRSLLKNNNMRDLMLKAVSIKFPYVYANTSFPLRIFPPKIDDYVSLFKQSLSILRKRESNYNSSRFIVVHWRRYSHNNEYIIYLTSIYWSEETKLLLVVSAVKINPSIAAMRLNWLQKSRAISMIQTQSFTSPPTNQKDLLNMLYYILQECIHSIRWRTSSVSESKCIRINTFTYFYTRNRFL